MEVCAPAVRWASTKYQLVRINASNVHPLLQQHLKEVLRQMNVCVILGSLVPMLANLASLAYRVSTRILWVLPLARRARVAPTRRREAVMAQTAHATLGLQAQMEKFALPVRQASIRLKLALLSVLSAPQTQTQRSGASMQAYVCVSRATLAPMVAHAQPVRQDHTRICQGRHFALNAKMENFLRR